MKAFAPIILALLAAQASPLQAMCAAKVREFAPNQLVISLEKMEAVGGELGRYATELIGVGLLKPEVQIEIPPGLLQINTPHLRYVEHTDLPSLQAAVDRVARTIGGQLYLQLLARWTQAIEQASGKKLGALLFLSFLNRPAFIDAEGSVNPSLIPYDLATRLLVTQLQNLADLDLLIQQKSSSSKKALTEEQQKSVLQTIAYGVRGLRYYVQPGSELFKGIAAWTRGNCESTGGALLPFRNLQQLDFWMGIYQTKGQVLFHKKNGRGLPITFYPFGSDFFGDQLLVEWKLSLGATPFQEVAGILSLSDAVADQILTDIDTFQQITLRYSFQIGIDEFIRSMQPFDSAQPPGANN